MASTTASFLAVPGRTLCCTPALAMALPAPRRERRRMHARESTPRQGPMCPRRYRPRCHRGWGCALPWPRQARRRGSRAPGRLLSPPTARATCPSWPCAAPLHRSPRVVKAAASWGRTPVPCQGRCTRDRQLCRQARGRAPALVHRAAEAIAGPRRASGTASRGRTPTSTASA